jgi:hypothetical protein
VLSYELRKDVGGGASVFKSHPDGRTKKAKISKDGFHHFPSFSQRRRRRKTTKNDLSVKKEMQILFCAFFFSFEIASGFDYTLSVPSQNVHLIIIVIRDSLTFIRQLIQTYFSSI